MAIILRNIDPIPSTDPYATPELWNSRYRDITYNFEQIKNEISGGIAVASETSNESDARKNNVLNSNYMYLWGGLDTTYEYKDKRVPTTEWVMAMITNRVNLGTRSMLNKYGDEEQVVNTTVHFNNIARLGNSSYLTAIDTLLNALGDENRGLGPTNIPNISVLRRIGCVHNFGNAGSGLTYVCFPLLNYFTILFGTVTFWKGGGTSTTVNTPFPIESPIGVIATPTYGSTYGAIGAAFSTNTTMSLDYPSADDAIKQRNVLAKITAFGFANRKHLMQANDRIGFDWIKDN